MAEDRYVTVAEVKEMLTEKNEERGELIPSLKAALTTATETCPLTGEQARELAAKCAEIIEPLTLTEYGRKSIPVRSQTPFPGTLRKYVLFFRRREESFSLLK